MRLKAIARMIFLRKLITHSVLFKLKLPYVNVDYTAQILHIFHILSIIIFPGSYFTDSAPLLTISSYYDITENDSFTLLESNFFD